MASQMFDILMVGDFRFPGGTSTCIAEQIRAQAGAGYRTGLIALKGPVLRHPHTFNSEIRACLDENLSLTGPAFQLIFAANGAARDRQFRRHK